MAYIYEKALRDRIYGILYDINKTAEQKKAEIERFLLKEMSDEFDGAPKMNPYEAAGFAMNFATYPWAKRFDKIFEELTRVLNEKYGIGFKTDEPPVDNGPEPVAPPTARPSTGPDPIAVASGYGENDKIPLRNRVMSALSKMLGGTKRGAAATGRGIKTGGQKTLAATGAVLGGAGAAAGMVAGGAAAGAAAVGRGAIGAVRAVRSSEPASKFGAFILVAVFVLLVTTLAIIGGGFAKIALPGIIMLLVLFAVLSRQFREEFLSLEGMLILITVALHVLYLTVKLASIFQALGVLVFIFILVIILYVNKGGDPKTGFVISTLSIIIYASPYILEQLGMYGVGADTASFIAMVLPLWPLFLLSKIKDDYPEGWASRIIFMYKLAVLAILMVYLWVFIARIDMPEVGSNLSIRDGAKATFERIIGTFREAVGRGETTINKITNPGEYYTSRVEDNKKLPLGVTIDGLRAADKVVDNETEVIIYGNVLAKSFIGDRIYVDPMCTTSKKGAPAASVDPIQMEVLYSSGQSFQCRFPPMSRGSYTITASATFPFETWAYIPFVFIDEERARNLAAQGQDINRVLDIPQQPIAIQTGGPIIVGMGGSPQPILVKPDREQMLPSGTRIGITVDNGWEEGRLQRVESVELKVPRPFEVTGCDRNVTSGPDQDPNEPEYVTYTFRNEEFDLTSTYSSVTCKLVIPPERAEEAAQLVSTGDKTTRSFVAVVKYRFVVEEKTTIQVN